MYFRFKISDLSPILIPVNDSFIFFKLIFGKFETESTLVQKALPCFCYTYPFAYFLLVIVSLLLFFFFFQSKLSFFDYVSTRSIPTWKQVVRMSDGFSMPIFLSPEEISKSHYSDANTSEITRK